MTQSFDEWFKENYPNQYAFKDSTLTCKYFYDGARIGAQSRQAEVDGLTIKLNGANERAMSLLNHKNRIVDKMQAEIDELRRNLSSANDIAERENTRANELQEVDTRKTILIGKLQIRINEALKILDGMRHNGAHRAIDILKGNKDEN